MSAMNYPLRTTKSQDEAGDRLDLISERRAWLQTSWPELLSFMAWVWGIEAGSITSILESVVLLLILPLGIRASLTIAILLHGTGHTLLIAAVDGSFIHDSNPNGFIGASRSLNLYLLPLDLDPWPTPGPGTSTFCQNREANLAHR
jgi:hypothetical protein